MKTQRPKPIDGSTLASKVLATRVAELGGESDATLEEALGGRSHAVAWACLVLAGADPLSIAENRIRRLRGSLSPDVKGPLGALLDHAKTAEALAQRLDAAPFLRSVRHPPTLEGTVRNAREELLEAVERVRYWSNAFLAEEKAERAVRSRESTREGAPVEEVALLLEAVALSVAPHADSNAVAAWANRLALDQLRPGMDPEHFARLKTRARRALEAGKRPRLRWALDWCEADPPPSS